MHSDRIARQAAEHFARRICGAPGTTPDGLGEWLRADPRHAQAYDEAQATWERLAALRGDEDLLALKRDRLAELHRQQQRRGWGLRVLTAAAVLVMSLAGGYVAYLRPAGVSPPVLHATALGERRTERLSDGSQLVLNTQTQVQVRYARRQREVEVLHGEAQFDVAPDAGRPFVVKAGQGVVTALGTRFQVRRDAQVRETRITLLEGSVEVATGTQRRVLHPGEQARLPEAGGLTVAVIDPESVEGWLDGWLRFRATPLAQVIAEVNRYASRKLRLGSPELAGVEMNGTFRAGESETIAAAAAMILPVRVDDSGPDIVLLPAR